MGGDRGLTLKMKAAHDGKNGSRSIAIMSKVMTSKTCNGDITWMLQRDCPVLCDTSKADTSRLLVLGKCRVRRGSSRP